MIITDDRKPHDYQYEGANFLTDVLFEQDEKGAGLFADVGAGKTLTILMFLARMKLLYGESALIIAPPDVCTTVWPPEAEEWGFDLTFQLLDGSTPAWRRTMALDQPADVYLSTPDLVKWLETQHVPAKVLIVDESDKFKNLTSARSKFLRKMLPQFKKRVIATATPATNGYQDLQSQVFILDDGRRLGKTKRYFQMHYMKPKDTGYGHEFKEPFRPHIDKLIAPIIHRMDIKGKVRLPRVDNHKVFVTLPPEARIEYDRMEEEMFVAIEAAESLRAQKQSRAFADFVDDFEDEKLEAGVYASNAGAKYAHCKGIAAGGIYETFGDERITHQIHWAKTEALKKIIDPIDTPVIVFFQFIHSLDKCLELWPDATVIRGGVSRKKRQQIVKDWNAGEIPLMFAQPMSMSHGLNMQKGPARDMVWLEPTDILGVDIQANGRLIRQGQKNDVINLWRLITIDTVEMLMADRLELKALGQTKLLDALKNYSAQRRLPVCDLI